MIDFDLFRKAASSAFNHSSQVINSVNYLLKLPLDAVFNLHNQGFDFFNKTMSAATRKDSFEIKNISKKDKKNEISHSENFEITGEIFSEIKLNYCHNFKIDLREVNVKIDKENRAKFQIIINNCENFSIVGGVLEDARNIILIANCSNFEIHGLRGYRSEGYGIIVFNSSIFKIYECYFEENLASGIYCLGNTAYGLIENNSFVRSRGFHNWDAGLHINHCTPDINIEAIPERSHEKKKIVEKVLKPSFLYVKNNFFSENRAQGIYCEGCILSSFINNIIEKNNKEGVCFDWGSALNLFEDNLLSMNGKRAKLSEAEIKADFIEDYPILPDNSSSAKLPGLSIDNGALNILCGNKIYHNYGGGIKMVRTGIANIISSNTLIDNNIGRNEHFKNFHGIFLFATGSGKREFVSSQVNLDLLPSELNLILSNHFYGHNRCFAVFAGPLCSNNYVASDNIYSPGSNGISENLNKNIE